MQLLLDIGNSAIKYCLYDGKQLLKVTRELYTEKSLDELLAKLNFNPEVTVAWISSVASDPVLFKVKQHLSSVCLCEIHEVSSQIEQNGIHNAYSDASQLGVDRWMALQATKSLGLSAAIIVSCGTAITVDLLNKQGQHQGGFISAGLGLQLQSLRSTALPKIEQMNIDVISNGFNLACDTENAVISGTLYSIVSWIDRVVVESCNKNNNNIPRVITGGDASLLLPYLSEQTRWRHEPTLVLQGIATIAGGS
ncbi:Pantothenate kinase type III, CoaX-like [hydrothermal vent metagenome]|uniref:Type III pantothenate kinase n=1 Tax=hydrothermal vent metagenome TaxID=652676 RepID=A0A3B0Z3E9_9ZZZZ